VIRPTSAVTAAAVRRYDKAFAREPRNRLLLNAVTANDLQKVARDRDAVVRADQTFSHLIKTGPATDQKQSGRCWLFAGLNLFREEAGRHLGLEGFELSQNHLMFWDKLEKSNYFLETMIEIADEPADGRLVWFLLQDPISDGGQWDMFANLVRKYGVVPKSVMPETDSSGSTNAMNAVVATLLREWAVELRRRHAAGEPAAALRARKDEMLEAMYRVLAIHLGRPPHEFVWQWRDKDDVFHRDGVVTPQDFFARYVGFDLDSVVSLINCPTEDKPFGRLYTVQYLGNVRGGDMVRYLNVSMDTFRRAAVEMILAGRPVWFGCDVGKMRSTKHGILDARLYDFEAIYGVPPVADKAERVAYGHSAMTHAMVLTGADLDEAGRPLKWRVENSWGKKYGEKGYFVMSGDWFEEYMFEVVVDRQFVPADVLALLDGEPVVLPPWDPMGSLARTL
jgi:bleomycin hydrolase